MFLDIVLNIPLNQTFTYRNLTDNNEDISTLFGRRVEVRFGNRKLTGYITDAHEDFRKECGTTQDKIRSITRFIDETPTLTQELYDIALWLSRYYLCPIGECVFSMVPSGRRETDTPGFSFMEDASSFIKRDLSDEQRTAVKGILSENQDSILHYLYGMTGSGKTEVFLTAAEELLNQGKGVIYLVPEIGLTPQVVEAVTRRFGNTVAVLHSGLTGSQKLKEWKRILNKDARVVIGARSAVFAPVPNLGLIIIDEEHDSSYKSGSSPRYHARQVAIHRCNTLKIPLVMGSATPSVEAWKLMDDGRIIRHVLTRRLAGGAMPEIKCVNLSCIKDADASISPQLAKEIRSTLEEKRQTILFLNRRGFTHFFRCNSCGYEIKCKNCSVSMTYHKTEKRLRCHYCGYTIITPQQCPKCSSLDVGYSGFGTEYIEGEVKSKFPNARVIRIDTDSVTHKGELQEKIDAFRRGDYDILLGTQMVAKGLNFPKLKTVGVVMADIALHMPDFRAAEKTFSLITQVAGRAGRFFPDGKVIVQSYSPDRAPIDFAIKNDPEGFYKQEIQTRQILGFPPFTRLLRLVFRSAIEQNAREAALQATLVLKNYHIPYTDVMGPSECPIEKIAQNFRQQVILRGQNIGYMQKAVQLMNERNPITIKNVYMEIDVDPINLL